LEKSGDRVQRDIPVKKEKGDWVREGKKTEKKGREHGLKDGRNECERK